MIVKVSQSVTGALKHYPFTGKSIDDDDEHETRISNVCRHVCVCVEKDVCMVHYTHV